MTEITLTIRSRSGTGQRLVDRTRFTIGRGDASLKIDDAGLAPIHASINHDGQRVWILDEGSGTGSVVNGKRVPGKGRQLADGDEITIGDETTIFVNISSGDASTRENRLPGALSRRIMIAPLVVAGVLLAGVAGFHLVSGLASSRVEREKEKNSEPAPAASPKQEIPPVVVAPPIIEPVSPPLQTSRKLYRDMTEQERMDFVDREAQKITMQISNSTRPEVFDDFVLKQIKKEVEGYARARGKAGLWGVTSQVIFDRAVEHAPYIIRCFNQEGVPATVGLYIVWIETAYVNVNYENFAHAMGLFQFIPSTARQYGVDPAERTNVKKMAPAAARYMKERIAQFGGDAKGVALAIANYNRGGTPQDLRKTIDSENPDRSFWTLMANKEKLNKYFQTENVNYVPRFFAAAIVGENPQTFGVPMTPLSSYATERESKGGRAENGR